MTVKNEKNTEDIIKEMINVGVLLGRKKSEAHPKMKSYIFGVRNGFAIFDLEKTIQNLDKAIKYIKELIKENKVILFVGTKEPAKKHIKELATSLDAPFIIDRWIGGMITNFSTLSSRIERFNTLLSKKEKGELSVYTKKEQLKISKELEKLEKKFGGIKNVKKVPDALFIVDLDKHKAAIREAKKKNVPVVAIVDSSSDPNLADYPIPANTTSAASLEYLFAYISKELKNNKK